jgi:hypothetical protein
LLANAGAADDARKRRVIQSPLAAPDFKTFLFDCLSGHTAESRVMAAS